MSSSHATSSRPVGLTADSDGKLHGAAAVGLVGTLTLAVVAFQLNANMLSPALPDIAHTLGESLDAVSQVSSLFFLAPPALIGLAAAPLAGWFAARVGWTLILRTGLVLCVAALIVIALSPESTWLVFAMVVILGITYNGLVLTTANGLGVLQPRRKRLRPCRA